MPCELCGGFGYINVPGSWFRGGPVQMPCECQSFSLLDGATAVDPRDIPSGIETIQIGELE